MTLNIPECREGEAQGSASVALVDGDIIAYRVGFAHEYVKYTTSYEGRVIEHRGKRELNKYLAENDLAITDECLDLQEELVVEPVENALHGVRELIESILENTKSGRYEIYLTGDGNFRTSLAFTVPYKGNRPDRKPAHYGAIREYLTKQWGATIINGMEADDQLAIRATALGDKAVICSLDKDLKQVPGRHYNWVTGKLETISELEGRRNLYVQMLTGDVADNIKGIYGIGEKTARKLLAHCESEDEMLEVIKVEYEKAFGDDYVARIHENDSLLYLLRYPLADVD